EKNGSAFRGAAQRHFLRGTDRIFATTLAPESHAPGSQAPGSQAPWVASPLHRPHQHRHRRTGIDHMLARSIAKSLAVLFFLTGYCAAQTTDPGPIRVGDRWSYNIKDALTGDLRQAITIVVGEINEKEITTRVSIQGKDRPTTMIWDPDWGRMD